MKHIITPVGTSLFTNFVDSSRGGHLERYLRRLREERAGAWDDQKPLIRDVRENRSFVQWLRGRTDASAELESISKIASGLGESASAHLLATDTILSRLAAELIAEYGTGTTREVEFHFNPDQDVIPGLQVRDAEDFRDGVRNLVRRIQDLLDQHGAHQSLINITGGYKATLPYLTIMGQVRGVPLRYKFEEADGLISIPQAPLSIDWSLFEEHEAQFKALEEGVDDWPAFKNEHYTFYQKADSCIHAENGIAILSPLGEVFWQRYRNRYFLFYAPDDVYENLQSMPDIRRILSTKGEYLKGDQKVEQKNGHYVYDDGNNENRIYFFRDGDDLYLYGAFEDHDAAEDFIEASIGEGKRRDIKERSVLRRIEKSSN